MSQMSDASGLKMPPMLLLHLAKFKRNGCRLANTETLSLRPRYCVRTKGKRAELDQPGACGKGQIYLEGAVKILRSLESTDFHALYSGRVSCKYIRIASDHVPCGIL